MGGNLSKASKVVKKAYGTFVKCEGENSIFAARALERMGSIYIAKNEASKSIRVYTRILNIKKKCYGHDHLEVAEAYVALGIAHKELSQFQDAIK
eukprot:5164717-Ditylum_brightwellii.AAC.1